MTTENALPWAEEADCAVTVCDTEGVILYMNEKARATFAQHGDLIGRNLFDCHNERSRETIRRMLASGGTNAYTIEKQGVRKMIYQTAWRERGEIRGLVEISMELPDEMPFRSCSDAIREPLRGGTARVTDIVALRVRPALYAGHGSYGRGSGSGYRYQAQPLHCGEQVADFFPPCVPFLREAGFRKLELSGLQLLRPAERTVPAGSRSHP